MSRLSRTLLSSVVWMCGAWPLHAEASSVKGTVEPGPATPAVSRGLGYTRTLVASRAAGVGSKRADVAVFLSATEAGVTPPPTQYEVAISNLRLEPQVAACVIDGTVSFRNDDRYAVTVIVESQTVGPIAPGQAAVYDCKTADPQVRRVRVKEWPHIRGSLFTGEIGMVSGLGSNGAFSISAPPGKYELHIIGETGSISKRPVEVQKTDVDVGRLVSGSAAVDADRPTIEPVKVESKPAARPAPTGVRPAKAAPDRAEKPGGTGREQELDFGE